MAGVRVKDVTLCAWAAAESAMQATSASAIAAAYLLVHSMARRLLKQMPSGQVKIPLSATEQD